MKNIPHKLLWTGFIVLISAAFSLQFACAVPLVAIAVVAALTLPPRLAVSAIAVSWAANQAIGYGILGYPMETMSFVWGGIIGLSGLLAYGAALLIKARASALPQMGRIAVMFVSAMIVYEAAMFSAALALGDGASSFTSDIIGQVLAVNLFALISLLVLEHVLASMKADAAKPAPKLEG